MNKENLEDLKAENSVINVDDRAYMEAARRGMSLSDFLNDCVRQAIQQTKNR